MTVTPKLFRRYFLDPIEHLDYDSIIHSHLENWSKIQSWLTTEGKSRNFISRKNDIYPLSENEFRKCNFSTKTLGLLL